MPVFQGAMQAAKRALPRGWSPLVVALAHILPGLQTYRAKLKDGDCLYLDLRERMCYGYFYYGELPHESGLVELLREELAIGDVFVDIGANVGYFTRMASKLVGMCGEVHAFDPMPAAYSLLSLNIADLPNVRIYPLALADYCGEAEFSVRRQGDESSLGRSGLSREIVRVQVSTLDKILAHADRVSFVKIDVEGYELSVLRGASQILSQHKPLVCFEYLPSNTNRLKASMRDFEDFFSAYGYCLSPVHNTCNVLAAPKETG